MVEWLHGFLSVYSMPCCTTQRPLEHRLRINKGFKRSRLVSFRAFYEQSYRVWFRRYHSSGSEKLSLTSLSTDASFTDTSFADDVNSRLYWHSEVVCVRLNGTRPRKSRFGLIFFEWYRCHQCGQTNEEENENWYAPTWLSDPGSNKENPYQRIHDSNVYWYFLMRNISWET